MPYDSERMALETLTFIHGLHVRDLSVGGYSPGWLEVSLLGVKTWDILEALSIEDLRRYLALKDKNKEEE